MHHLRSEHHQYRKHSKLCQKFKGEEGPTVSDLSKKVLPIQRVRWFGRTIALGMILLIFKSILWESTKQVMTGVQGNNNPTPPTKGKNWPGHYCGRQYQRHLLLCHNNNSNNNNNNSIFAMITITFQTLPIDLLGYCHFHKTYHHKYPFSLGRKHFKLIHTPHSWRVIKTTRPKLGK